MKQELYVSTDVEADGLIPGVNSMLSFGSAVYTKDKELVSTFEANLELLDGATGDERTMEWWSTEQEAWKACRLNLEKPSEAMSRYLTWLKKLEGNLVLLVIQYLTTLCLFIGI